MRRMIAVWNEFWHEPPDPYGAALFRASVGAIAVVELLSLRPVWADYYGARGVSGPRGPGWSLFDAFPATPMEAWWWAGLAAAVLFALGWRARIWTAALFLLYSSMVHANRMATNGEDLVLRGLLFHSMFARLDSRLSLSSWLAAKRGVTLPPGPGWPIRLMQVNVAAVYAISLPNKLLDDFAWVDGRAIYYTIASGIWSRWPWPLAAAYPPLPQLATWGTVLIEASFPIVCWLERGRRPAALALIALHVGIAFAVKNVAFFSLAMAAAACLFLRRKDLPA